MAFSQFAIIGRNFELLQETLERQNGEYSTRIYDDIVHLLAGESNHLQGLCRAFLHCSSATEGCFHHIFKLLLQNILHGNIKP